MSDMETASERTLSTTYSNNSRETLVIAPEDEIRVIDATEKAETDYPKGLDQRRKVQSMATLHDLLERPS